MHAAHESLGSAGPVFLNCYWLLRDRTAHTFHNFTRRHPSAEMPGMGKPKRWKSHWKRKRSAKMLEKPEVIQEN